MIRRKNYFQNEADQLINEKIDNDKFKEQCIEQETEQTNDKSGQSLIKVMINDRLEEYNLKKSCKIKIDNSTSIGDIIKQLCENPFEHTMWEMRYNEALCNLELLKTEFDVWKSKKAQTYCTWLKGTNKENANLKTIQNMLESSTDFNDYKKRIILARKNVNNIRAISNSFLKKAEILMSIGSMLKSNL